MTKKISFNAFEMNCIAHQSPGLWRHPQDRSVEYKDLEYWTDLAQILERGFFDGIFIADVLGIYDVYHQSAEHALTGAVQVPVNDPLQIVRRWRQSQSTWALASRLLFPLSILILLLDVLVP